MRFIDTGVVYHVRLDAPAAAAVLPALARAAAPAADAEQTSFDPRRLERRDAARRDRHRRHGGGAAAGAAERDAARDDLPGLRRARTAGHVGRAARVLATDAGGRAVSRAAVVQRGSAAPGRSRQAGDAHALVRHRRPRAAQRRRHSRGHAVQERAARDPLPRARADGRQPRSRHRRRHPRPAGDGDADKAIGLFINTVPYRLASKSGSRGWISSSACSTRSVASIRISATRWRASRRTWAGIGCSFGVLSHALPRLSPVPQHGALPVRR